MKVFPIVKFFLIKEDIQDIINEGDIDKVFGEFYNYLGIYDLSISSNGELIQQIYNLMVSAGIKWQERYITKMFEFISKIIGRKVRTKIGGIGTVFDMNFLNYSQYKDDLTNFNNATWEVKFDNGMEATILGNELKLI